MLGGAETHAQGSLLTAYCICRIAAVCAVLYSIQIKNLVVSPTISKKRPLAASMTTIPNCAMMAAPLTALYVVDC